MWFKAANTNNLFLSNNEGVTDINFKNFFLFISNIKTTADLLGFGFCRRSKGYTVCFHRWVIFKVSLRSGLFSHILTNQRESWRKLHSFGSQQKNKSGCMQKAGIPPLLHSSWSKFSVMYQLHPTLKVMLYTVDFSCACHWRLRPFLHNHYLN